jgi:predicted N-acetyltransferase YhbS
MQPSFVRTDQEWEELAALIELVFGAADADLWRNFHRREPFCRREWCKIIKAEGRIVSHVCWAPRLMRVGSAVVRAGAIGYTVTHPDYRRRGLAATLMADWTDELTHRGEHISFLTGIPGFYQQFGYEFCFPLDLRDSPVRITPDLLPAGTADMRLRPYTAGDLPNLMALYDQENAARTGSLVRTRAYWEWLLNGLHAIRRINAKGIWLVENARHEPAGYVMLRSGATDELDVYEAACPDASAAAILLCAAATRARAEGKRRIDLKLPLDHRMTRYALACGADLSGYSSGMYARILDLQGLFEALQPELERRWRRSAPAGWKGTLRLITDIGSVDLALAEGSVEPGTVVPPVQSVEIPQALLVKLVTGYTSPQWVAGTLDVQWVAGLSRAHIAHALRPVVQALFPKGCPYVWNADTGY